MANEMNWPEVWRKVVEGVAVSVLAAALLGTATLLWNNASNGQVVALFGGATKADLASVAGLKTGFDPSALRIANAPSKTQTQQVQCEPDEVMLAAFCTNDARSQAAVGPVLSGNSGQFVANCYSYNPAGRLVEAQAICMRIPK